LEDDLMLLPELQRALLSRRFLPFRLDEIVQDPGLSLPVEKCYQSGSQQDEQPDDQADEARPVTGLGKNFLRIHLGRYEPGRVRNRKQRTDHFSPTIVPSLEDALFAKGSLNGGKLRGRKRVAQGKGGVGTMPEVIEKNDIVTLALDHERFGTAAGCGPFLE
jgi:hypothetical protein